MRGKESTLNVTTERLENCIVALDIALEEQESTNYMRSAARTLSRKYRIPGFRPGKAPYGVVVRRFGIEAVQSQVLEQFGEQIFEKGMKESELKPADKASLEEVTWDPALTLHVKVPVGPEVDLGAYRDIRIPWEEPTVTDEDLEEALLRLREENVEWTQAERPAELGDQVVLDIASTVDGNVVLQNKAREMVLNADSPYPLPGFAEQVVGMTAGGSREFDLTYPEDHYNPDTAGKVGHLQVHLQEIKVKELPPLDDEFAILVGDYEGLENLRTSLRQSLLEKAEQEAEQAHMTKLWEHLFEVATVEYPAAYVDREIEVIKNEIGSSLQRQGMDMETYFKLTNTTEEAWKEQVRPQAMNRLRQKLILAQVVSDQQIQLEEGEIDAEVERMVEPLGEGADEMREALKGPQGVLMVSDSLLTDKAIERLKEIARGQAPGLEGAEAEPSAGDVSQAVEAEAEAELRTEPQPEAPPEAKVVQETVPGEKERTSPEGEAPEAVEAKTEAEAKAETEPSAEAQVETTLEVQTVPEEQESTPPELPAAQVEGDESTVPEAAGRSSEAGHEPLEDDEAAPETGSTDEPEGTRNEST
jgi:trigger factor